MGAEDFSNLRPIIRIRSTDKTYAVTGNTVCIVLAIHRMIELSRKIELNSEHREIIERPCPRVKCVDRFRIH